MSFFMLRNVSFSACAAKIRYGRPGSLSNASPASGSLDLFSQAGFHLRGLFLALEGVAE
jgi:hypothetical protein